LPSQDQLDEIKSLANKIITSKQNIYVSAQCIYKKLTGRLDLATPLGFTEVALALRLFPSIKNEKGLKELLVNLKEGTDLTMVPKIAAVLETMPNQNWLELLQKIDIHKSRLFIATFNAVYPYSDPSNLDLTSFVVELLVKERIDISVIFELEFAPINFFNSLLQKYPAKAEEVLLQLHSLGFFGRVSSEHLLLAAVENKRADLLEKLFLSNSTCTDTFEKISHISINLAFHEVISRNFLKELSVLLKVFPKERMRQLSAFFTHHKFDSTPEVIEELLIKGLYFSTEKELKKFIEIYSLRRKTIHNIPVLEELLRRSQAF
jgi:hypothetical protein